MKNECSIIRDLLPLYAENMVSADTAAFVADHLRDCEACRKEYERSREPQPAREMPDAAPLVKLRRKMKIRKIQTIALTAVFLIAVFVSAFAVLDAPVYFPYSEGLVTISPLADTSLLLTFDEKVTGFDYRLYAGPAGQELCYCDIQAWTSLWDRWFLRRQGSLSATVTLQDARPVIAVYVPNDGSETVCIAKYDPAAEDRMEKPADYESAVVLPRLSLGYYLILAVMALTAFSLVWLLTRRKAEARVWVERLGLYPLSYILSHCIVSGIHWASYSLPRDLSLILFISILLYGGLLLAHELWRAKKEREEVTP